MSELLYTCEACNKTIQLRNRKRHDQSKYHLQREGRVISQLRNYQPPDEENKESCSSCSICLENLLQPEHCVQCKQSWCGSCDKNIFKCPFCRLQIKGRETESRQFESTLLNDYGLLMMEDETNLEGIIRRIALLDFLGNLFQRLADR